MIRPKLVSMITAWLMLFLIIVSPGAQAASAGRTSSETSVQAPVPVPNFLLGPVKCEGVDKKMGARHIAIVFATDRELACNREGKPTGFTSKRSKRGVSYGIAVVHVDKVKTIMATEPKVCPHNRFLKTVVHRFDTPFQKNSHIESVELLATRDALFDRMSQLMQQYGYKKVIVRVHGYNNDWQYSVRKTAEFAYWTDSLLVNWAWPSDAKKRSYFAASVNAEWTLKNFEEFVDALAEDQRFGGANNVGLAAHSMGTRIVFWYEKLRYEKLSRSCTYGNGDVSAQMVNDVHPLPDFKRFWFTQLASPDMDTETYCHDGRRVVACTMEDKVFNYISKYDHPLRWSKGINGYTRLGRAGVDLDWKEPPKVEGVVTIDFSIADHGPTGHAEPQWLESDMATNGSPRDPYCLIQKVEGNPNFKLLTKDCNPESK